MDVCIRRLERETLKYMEIQNIFYRLHSTDYVQSIYGLFKNIFENEHKFTITVQIINYLRNSKT